MRSQYDATGEGIAQTTNWQKAGIRDCRRILVDARRRFKNAKVQIFWGKYRIILHDALPVMKKLLRYKICEAVMSSEMMCLVLEPYQIFEKLLYRFIICFCILISCFFFIFCLLSTVHFFLFSCLRNVTNKLEE